MGTVRILYRASTISLQAAVHPKYTLGGPEHERISYKLKHINQCTEFMMDHWLVKDYVAILML